MEKIDIKRIYTDGMCEPNPGRGTWAFVVPSTGYTVAGHESVSTNNRMELAAVIGALRYAEKKEWSNVVIISDSKYCVDGFNSWMHKWKKKGIMPKKANTELWELMWELKDSAVMEWVKGHAGNRYNEEADIACTKKYEELWGKVPERAYY